MTSLTLRKALRLKKQMEDEARCFDASLTVEIDIDSKAADNIKEHLQSEEAKYLKDIENSVRLSKILSELRDNIDKSNTNSGVNTFLARIAHIDRQLLMLKSISDAQAVDEETLSNKIIRKREALSKGNDTQPRYGRNLESESSVSACVLSDEIITQYKVKILSLRKERETLEDERLILNNSPKNAIEISEDDVSFLSGIGIV